MSPNAQRQDAWDHHLHFSDRMTLPMQRLTADHLFHCYNFEETMPEHTPLTVLEGESFMIETTDTAHRRVCPRRMSTYHRPDVWKPLNRRGCGHGTQRRVLSGYCEKPLGPMAGNPSTGPKRSMGLRRAMSALRDSRSSEFALLDSAKIPSCQVNTLATRRTSYRFPGRRFDDLLDVFVS